MAQVELKAQKREGKKLKHLRADGFIPAVIYGRKFKATPVAIEAKEFQKKVLQSDAGQNLIFYLKLSDNGQSVPVITQQLQRSVLTDKILHLDFMNIIMDEAIKARVPVELTGVPEGVKEEGGVLVHGLREIEVKCLPLEIPDKFVVDVTSLKINESLHVSDIKTKVEILAQLTEMIATVSPPTKEEVVAPAPLTPEEAAAAAAAAPEGAAGAEAAGAEKAPAKEAAAAPAPAKASAPAKPSK